MNKKSLLLTDNWTPPNLDRANAKPCQKETVDTINQPQITAVKYQVT